MRKSLVAGLACLSLAVTAAAPYAALAKPIEISPTENGQSTLRPLTSDVAVIAHRGASAYGPEHTLAAYKQAMTMKADYVEFDLQMTKDGQLIAMHDETLARTTNAKELYPDRAPWRVKDFTLDEIKRLDAGSWFNKAYPDKAKQAYIGQQVPTLEEAIEFVKQHGNGKVGLYMETKAPNVYPGMEEKVIDILKKTNVLDSEMLFLESFSEDSLRKLKTLAPAVKLIQLYTGSMLAGKDVHQEMKRISDYAAGVGPSKELVVPKLMEAAHQNKLLVHPWTVNAEDDMVSLLSLGVDGQFTNNTDLLVNLVEKPFVSHGVASGDVTDSSAILWARTNAKANVQFEISTDSTFKKDTTVKTSPADVEHDFTVNVKIDGLKPDTTYYYRAHAVSSKYNVNGSFKTAPEENSLKPLTMVWGGDTGGQGEIPPFKSYKAMSALNPDFFLFSGDTIYADNATPAVPNPPSETVQDFWAKYKENRTDAGLHSLLQKTGTFAIWDDHEVTNDFSGPSQPLTPTGLSAFKDYWPISGERSEADKLYHKYSWGNTMDMIILNNRGYRSPNNQADGADKTMLGDEQLQWLKQQLLESDAKVKLVATSVPISIPTGKAMARDGWANGDNVNPNDPTGYENEFKQISDFIIEKGIKNVFFVTTDVHFAEVIKYDANHDGKADYNELISGPIGAVKINPGTLDPTFGPEKLYAEGNFFNYGVFRVDPATQQATVEIQDENGKTHFSHTFELE
ncbi:glycerophosphodiester phosphodiesterase family protein [Neobacillus rhizophilus]|uniref:Alkaline phosphatase D family protein n=1 Tax=Neobacillus rhizophilus TaxID=2833579 RepID=A0A942U529_9BACI|nr:glycerophosphodiester phosphodiesterase family protein [Neobacillus rhizophilus]MBS4212873.1 alkaline phosphatase D family protein [Neobacillus rhizophilus]